MRMKIYWKMRRIILLIRCRFEFESTGGSTYSDCIMELAANIIGVPNSVVLMQRHSSCLVHTSCDINAVSKYKVGLSTAMLKDNLFLLQCLKNFYHGLVTLLIKWMNGKVLSIIPSWLHMMHGFAFDYIYVDNI